MSRRDAWLRAVGWLFCYDRISDEWRIGLTLRGEHGAPCFDAPSAYFVVDATSADRTQDNDSCGNQGADDQGRGRPGLAFARVRHITIGVHARR